jgi:nicotinamide-nucleotide amidase
MKNLDKRLNAISNILIKRNETLAVAESVTAGMLMTTLSLSPDATRFFQDVITAYNLGQRQSIFRLIQYWPTM